MSDHALRLWRKENGVTLTTLASRVGVTPSHLSEVENRRNMPSIELAAKLSRETQGSVPLDAFVPRTEAAE
jgi:transcriptional regulator with XRE-family HTH domain